MEKILIVDDDINIRYSFKRMLQSKNYFIIEAESGEEALEIIKKDNINLVILDVRIKGMNGIETLKKIKEQDSKIPVIIITAYGTTDIAIEAMKLGAFDYIPKPFEIKDMKNLIERALNANRLMKDLVIYYSEKEFPEEKFKRIIGKHPKMQDVYKLIGQVSQSDVPILIIGESGTGKELVARAIYTHSSRYNKPFLAVNCAAIPESLLESELFGYVKGAFTGAKKEGKVGLFEQAHEGTIFLDEIGEISQSIQARLLRVLQEHKVRRLGDDKVIPIDVRIITSTNKKLIQLVRENKFRDDLYYRINVLNLDIPPLRERTFIQNFTRN